MDRDGVVNVAPPQGEYLSRCEDLIIIPSAIEWIKLARDLHFSVIVLTNQRGVATGKVSLETVSGIHDHLLKHLVKLGAPIDAIYTCPHSDGECGCRKPLPGLFQQAMRDWHINQHQSILIGDSVRDCQLAHNCQLTFLMAKNGRIQRTRLLHGNEAEHVGQELANRIIRSGHHEDSASCDSLCCMSGL